MSKELAKICEGVLQNSGLLTHTYGIPKILGNLAGQLKEILRLEGEYSKLYKQLTTKVDRLIYLNKLQEIESLNLSQIDELYQNIRNEFPRVNEGDLEDFLIKQNNGIKTDIILANYLQIILPILKSIHSSNLSLTEANILKNMKKNFEIDSGLTFQIIASYKQQSKDEINQVDLLMQLSRHLKLIKPKLSQFDQLNHDLIQANQKLISQKSKQINDIDVNEQDLMKKYRHLLNQWNYLLKICQFLPILITTLSINWFEDKTLFNIVHQCQDYLQKLEKYQAIICVNDLEHLTISDLLMLDFSEIQNGEID